MKNLKISTKLLIGFLTLALLTAVVGAIGVYGLRSINRSENELYNDNLIAVSAMSDLRDAIQANRLQLRTVLVIAELNPAGLQSVIDGFAPLETAVEDAMAKYEATITSPENETPYYTAKNMYFKEYGELKSSIIADAQNGRTGEAFSSLVKSTTIIAPMMEGLTASTAYNNQEALDKMAADNAQYGNVFKMMIAAMLVSVATAVALGVYISKLIVPPISFLAGAVTSIASTGSLDLPPEAFAMGDEIAERKDEIGKMSFAIGRLIREMLIPSADSLKTIASGDLTVEVKKVSPTDTMGGAMEHMVENLNDMFGGISTASAQVSGGAAQLSQGAQSLAQGSTEQAAAVEQLSASVAEVAGKAQDNEHKATRAAQLSDTIKVKAQKGSGQMADMMQAVREISEASNSIGKVIKVIDDIAFQTNILALNAAVEAARAGQHGKGFAVVAEEVRNLAAKSAEAAKVTSQLIADSIEKAELGAKIAAETSTSLEEIVHGVNESTIIVNDIARSSADQAAAISQINIGVDQVAIVVQQNNATAEESAAASEEMSSQSDNLNALLSQFKLKDGNRRLAAPSQNKKHAALPDGFGSFNNFMKY